MLTLTCTKHRKALYLLWFLFSESLCSFFIDCKWITFKTFQGLVSLHLSDLLFFSLLSPLFVEFIWPWSSYCSHFSFQNPQWVSLQAVCGTWFFSVSQTAVPQMIIKKQQETNFTLRQSSYIKACNVYWILFCQVEPWGVMTLSALH